MVSKKLILLVEDNEELNDFNSLLLQGEGYDVKAALTLADAHRLIEKQKPDAIILDIGMPDGDGRDFLRTLRTKMNIPVLFLTGYKRDADVLSGYESGCDDYVVKPYTFKILCAKLNRLLQRAEQLPEQITRGNLELDLMSLTGYAAGSDMQLTQKEFALLLLLVQNEGRVMSTEYIYETVWKEPMTDGGSVVKAVVKRLRDKMAGCDFCISDARGGYRAGYS